VTDPLENSEEYVYDGCGKRKVELNKVGDATYLRLRRLGRSGAAGVGGRADRVLRL